MRNLKELSLVMGLLVLFVTGGCNRNSDEKVTNKGKEVTTSETQDVNDSSDEEKPSVGKRLGGFIGEKIQNAIKKNDSEVEKDGSGLEDEGADEKEESEDEPSDNSESSAAEDDADTPVIAVTVSAKEASKKAEVKKVEEGGMWNKSVKNVKGFFAYTLVPFSLETPYWWLWILLAWLVFSILATCTLERVVPFSRPSDNTRFGNRIRMGDESHPLQGGVVMSLPIIWFLLANWGILPAFIFAKLLWTLAIVVVTILVILAGWSMLLRWKIHCKYDWYLPFKAELNNWLEEHSDDTDPDNMSETQKIEWSRYWENRGAAKQGCTIKAPKWSDNKMMIAEWTFLFPLSIQQVIWVLFIRDGFWTAMEACGGISDRITKKYDDQAADYMPVDTDDSDEG